MKINQKLFAFWKYDGFPTKQCLGAEIEEFGKNGSIMPAGYGYCYFKPFKICLFTEGQAINEELKALDIAYNKELKALKDKYSKLHNEILIVLKG